MLKKDQPTTFVKRYDAEKDQPTVLVAKLNLNGLYLLDSFGYWRKVKKIMDSEKGSNFILCENINKTKNILLQTEAIMYAEIKMTLFSIMIC